MKLYGIFDRASGMYVDRILVLPADLAARRIFVEACNDQRSEIAKYPSDYELWRLGDLDPNTGAITPELDRIMVGEVSVKDG